MRNILPHTGVNRFRYLLCILSAFLILGLSGCSKPSDKPLDKPTNGTAQSNSLATPKQQTQLRDALQAYRAATDARDFEAVFDRSIPPAMVEVFMSDAGLNATEFRRSTANFMATAFEQIDSFEYQIADENIKYEKLNDGTLYAPLAVKVVMKINGRTINADDETIALYENERWYLVRVSESESAEIFKQAYPQFKDIDFTSMTFDVE